MASKKARKLNQSAAKKVRRRTNIKKQLPQHKSTSVVYSTCSSSSTTSFIPPQDTAESVPSPSPELLTSSVGGCCTPEAKKSRIPEILTCPPAPKKQRVRQNGVLRRRKIVFFAPPEIELFFVNVNAHNR